MTSVPPVTSHDKSWPYCSTSDAIIFDQNWHHLHCILNFCRRKIFIQVFPDQSDQLHEPEIWQECPEILSEKLKSKICSNYTWLLHGKNCLSRCMMLSHIVWFRSKPSRRSITLARQIEKDKKRQVKNKTKP